MIIFEIAIHLPEQGSLPGEDGMYTGNHDINRLTLGLCEL